MSRARAESVQSAAVLSGTFEVKPEMSVATTTPGFSELQRLSLVSERRTPQTQALLERMITAMGLALKDVSLIEADLEDFAFRSVGKFDSNTGPELRRLVILFGKPRSGIYRAEVLDVLPTHSLDAILNSPSAKKEVWLDLQQAVQLLGLKLPSPSGRS